MFKEYYVRGFFHTPTTHICIPFHSSMSHVSGIVVHDFVVHTFVVRISFNTVCPWPISAPLVYVSIWVRVTV